MIDQAPQIPPAVIEFAEQNGCENVHKHILWTKEHPYKDYDAVYHTQEKGNPTSILYILEKDDNFHLTTFEEAIEIFEQEPYL